ncbi:GNAT family N-acetyltransferase [Actibacterium lipolyticum]|uniref:Acetyltransferase (GNAT) family protein n=1 Tax=Actibacterium lipolyticum TaxID=1524263 RepID=A0A238JLP8_9RHOB|nr:GNAT family N-acetyltransferase [Actibacterium lipolyticum]SMX30716.1 Acetyltransferase (GNAT) family protein [Actibacterium lipolyticum]
MIRTPDIYKVAEATWPPASTQRIGPWMIRDGQGGGKRVSAATAEAAVQPADLGQAETAMEALGQTPLFMVRNGEDALDQLLENAGYEVIDPVAVYAIPISEIATQRPPPISAFTIWEPLKIMEELWAEGGIGPARLAVMARVKGPKTGILGRVNDRAAGTAFAAIHEKTAMIHAIEVTDTQRRQGTAINMMRETAFWAQDHGADTLVVLVTEANAPARALYASLGMKVVENYHYRIRSAETSRSS